MSWVRQEVPFWKLRADFLTSCPWSNILAAPELCGRVRPVLDAVRVDYSKLPGVFEPMKELVAFVMSSAPLWIEL